MAATPTSPTPVAPAPRVDVDSLVGGLQPPSGTTGKPSVTHPAQMEGYFAALKQRALEAYVRPPGVPEGLAVTVSFQLSAEGVLSRLVILKSSDNRDFDDAVLAAFRKLHVRPRPDRLTDEREMTFRTVDLAR